MWDRDELLAKAGLYLERAAEADRSTALFPFWCFLALEHVGRAALAHVHPVLLADPQEGKFLLHAFGFQTDAPRSVTAKTVFDRCKTVVPEFTDRDFKFCMSLMHLRNEELHTGAAVLEDVPLSQWLARFYGACRTLLKHMELDLADLLPASELEGAEAMLAQDAETVLSEVKEAIGRARHEFLERTDADRQEALEEAKARATQIRLSDGVVADCPACSGKGRISGETVTVTERRLREDHLYWETIVLPTEFSCLACGLYLTEYQRLEAAQLGGQYTVEHWADPVEYYGDQAIQAYMEPDYGND